VFVAGAPTPKLLPRELVQRMRRGAMIVDISIMEGGIAENLAPTTHDDPVYEDEGVLHYCVGQHARGAARGRPPREFRKRCPFRRWTCARRDRERAAERSRTADAVLLWEGRAIHRRSRGDGLAYTALSPELFA
jgi:alanine dehydrogenase